MLEPLNRRHLFDALRTPLDYEMDVALGTSYTLDLTTLLTVPLSFALFDWEDEEGRPAADPLALLEAIRRFSDRIHIFCQAGAIAIPRTSELLMSHLEGCVHEVSAPHPEGIFHPKLWVLRFKPKDKEDPIVYRVLCLSRNLTFDRSWDTLLSLEGELTDRQRAFSRNHPLGEFVEALSGLARDRVPAPVRKMGRMVADELRRVRFEFPGRFEDLKFHPMGLEGTKRWTIGGRKDRVMVISPFVTGRALQSLRSDWGEDVLVSRLDELKATNPADIEEFSEVHYLDTDADLEEQEGVEEEGPPEVPPMGLHAKLFVAEAGWDARVFTGSANATDAAFTRNVEFMVELRGKKSFCGIDALLGTDNGSNGLAGLLQEYQPSPKEVDATRRDAEERLRKARRAIALRHLSAKVSPIEEDGRFLFAVERLGGGKIELPQGVDVKCWPITLPEAGAVIPSLGKTEFAQFGPLSFEGLTSFLGFEIRTKLGGETLRERFVLNLPVEGMPADRKERVLKSLLSNQHDVLRFIRLLLAEEAGEILAEFAKRKGSDDGGGEFAVGRDYEDVLLEPMMRTLYADPGKLDHVARLVEDFVDSPEGKDLLPKGFLSIWDPIWEVRRRQRDEKEKGKARTS